MQNKKSPKGQKPQRPSKSHQVKKFSNQRKAETPEYDIKKLKSAEVKEKELKEGIRLNKYIANAGICSRREADKHIADGKVKVNNKLVKELGFKVKPTDDVAFEGKPIKREKLVYVLLNKPKGFITTMDDPKGRKTVMDLISAAGDERIYPVGRLDRNTTGLLLFTNDGELVKKLTHPKHKVKKIYQVELDKPITEVDFLKIQEGITLEDGEVKVDNLALLTPDAQSLGMEIRMGRNRIVRRTFEHLGYEVVKLDRTTFAGLTKKDLARGKWRFLKEKEVINLKHLR
ncbi:pseudouridine synthase [Marivirga harenae]|uniref:pseudouridine synthase n=1 Tax=Marivirga harenae TaxID=2010992 RepID=UPI0026DFCFA9|nr:pseudouridine synthase [Marivirga harenae]WKV13121.1 pseudouridine synthase [Marivirga harenae]|tara:strand:+ start:263434 stop:264294 length:861 start_codon:yes stop_codon:yes gene_type:complete